MVQGSAYPIIPSILIIRFAKQQPYCNGWLGIRDAKKSILDPTSYPGIQLQLAQIRIPHLNPIRTRRSTRFRWAADASAEPRARATQKAEDPSVRAAG
jgi:hypothetical protein